MDGDWPGGERQEEYCKLRGSLSGAAWRYVRSVFRAQVHPGAAGEMDGLGLRTASRHWEPTTGSEERDVIGSHVTLEEFALMGTYLTHTKLFSPVSVTSNHHDCFPWGPPQHFWPWWGEPRPGPLRALVLTQRGHHSVFLPPQALLILCFLSSLCSLPHIQSPWTSLKVSPSQNLHIVLCREFSFLPLTSPSVFPILFWALRNEDNSLPPDHGHYEKN